MAISNGGGPTTGIVINQANADVGIAGNTFTITNGWHYSNKAHLSMLKV
jgi:hypothetical protein